MYGIRRQPPSWRQAANATALSWGTADTASILLHGQCDPFLLYGDELSISLNSAIYFRIYCRVSYFQVRPLTASLPLFTQGGARNKVLAFFHWTLKWNNSITEPTTSTQARTRIACMGVRTLNQLTSRDGLRLLRYIHYNVIPGSHI